MSVPILSCTADTNALPAPTPSKSGSSLRVALAIPIHMGHRLVHSATPGEHFHVVLENVSAEPLKLWTGREYLGYANLSFRITGQDGTTSIVKRRALPPGSEIDMSVVLGPGEFLVINVDPASDEWTGFPKGSTKPQSITVQAIYTSEMPKADSRGWTGRILSPTYEVDWVE